MPYEFLLNTLLTASWCGWNKNRQG